MKREVKFAQTEQLRELSKSCEKLLTATICMSMWENLLHFSPAPDEHRSG
jgi:hypothetical protein